MLFVISLIRKFNSVLRNIKFGVSESYKLLYVYEVVVRRKLLEVFKASFEENRLNFL